MTEQEALDEAAKAAVQMGWEYVNSENLLFPAEYDSIRAHAATIMENAALKAEIERLREHIARQANTINIVGSPYHRAMEALDEIVSSVKHEARAALKEISNGDR